MRVCALICLAACVLALVSQGAGVANAAEVIYVKGSNVNIRSGPGTDTGVVTKLNRNHKLTVIGRTGRWFQVTFAGAEQKGGWIRDDLISKAPIEEPKRTPGIRPPSVAELSTPQGVVTALNEAPRDRVLEAFKVAIRAAGEPCDTVVSLSQTLSRPEGVYYVVGCRSDKRYSVLVKPDGKLGTKVTSCARAGSVGGVDLCGAG